MTIFSYTLLDVTSFHRFIYLANFIQTPVVVEVVTQEVSYNKPASQAIISWPSKEELITRRYNKQYRLGV